MKKIWETVLENKMRRTIAFLLALVVTFTTTYTLVLPAITIDRDTAATTAGIDLGHSDSTSGKSESAGDDDGDNGESAGDADAVSDSQEKDTVAFDAKAEDVTADGERRTMSVHVEAEVGAFPEGTTMEVDPVEDETVIDTISQAVDGEVSHVHAVDITFLSQDGEEVQAEDGYDVKVMLSSDQVQAERDNTVVVACTDSEKDEAEDQADRDDTVSSQMENTDQVIVQAVETDNEVEFQTEPEHEIDTDNAATFTMEKEAGQTFAIVETDVENPSVGEDGTQNEEADVVDAEEESVADTENGETAEEGTVSEDPADQAEAEDQGMEPSEPFGDQPVEEMVVPDAVAGQIVQLAEQAENQLYTNSLEAETEDGEFTVRAEFTEDAFRETNPKLLVSTVEAKEYEQAAIDAVDADLEAPQVKALDITFVDEEGNELQPEGENRVKLTIKAAFLEDAVQSEVVHMKDTRDGTVVDNTSLAEDEITLRAESFSVYAIVYTVDFKWDVNGETYAFHLSGGDSTSFRSLVEELHILDTSEKNDGFFDRLTSSDDVSKFLDDIKQITFSNPELVWVGQLSRKMTAGQIAEENGLEVTYSGELTESEISRLEGKKYKANEWVLLGLKPFLSEETLTVSMKSGESFEVKVTDDQIKTAVITASGDAYEITVTYGEDAMIPEGSELNVEEITEGHERYSTDCEKAEEAVQEKFNAGLGKTALFDISIVHDGEPVEPAPGSQVSVEIKLAQSVFGETDGNDAETGFIEIGGEVYNLPPEKGYGVIHITEEGETDVVNLISEEVYQNGDVDIAFVTESFSDYIIDADTEVTKWNGSKERYYLDVLPTTLYVGDTINIVKHANYNIDWQNPSGVVTEKKYENLLQNNPGGYTDNDGPYRVFTLEKEGKFQLGGRTITVASRPSDNPPDTIDTLNNNDIGVSLNMFDYDLDDYLDDYFNQFNYTLSPYYYYFKDHGINKDHTLKFWGSGVGNWDKGVQATTAKWIDYMNTYQDAATTGIVENELSGGYPVIKGKGESLNYLFGGQSHPDVEPHIGVDKLFQKTADGYYIYDSDKNYAYLDGSEFKVYNDTYHQWSKSESPEMLGFDNGKPIGFFPFHPWNSKSDLFVNWDKGLNHHFGMELDVNFILPDGEMAMVDRNGNDIIFEFSGDDDVWIFIDDHLALDIGGIHQPTTGLINFTKKEVKTTVGTGNNKKEVTQTTFNSFWNTLKDGKPHTLKMFYMERGGCDSNCMIKYNLTQYTNLEFEKFDKKTKQPLPGVKYQLWEKIRYNDEDGKEQVRYEHAYWWKDVNGQAVKEMQEVTTGADGKVRFNHVPVGEYVLKEISAPADYVLKSDDDLEVKIVKNGDGSFTVTTDIDKLDELPDQDGIQVTNNKPEPIELSVSKTWLDADGGEILDPSQYSATFTVHRTKTYKETVTEEGEPEKTSTLKIGYYYDEPGWFGSRRILSLYDKTYYYVVGSKATITFNYNDWHTQDRKYMIGEEEKSVSDTGSIEITMPPENEEIIVYFYDGWKNGNALDSVTANGKTPENTSVQKEVLREDVYDSSFDNDSTINRTLTLSGGVTSATFNSGLFSESDDAGKFPIQETIDGVTYKYKYYITEEPVSGFTATPSSSSSTGTDYTAHFTNRKNKPPIPIDVDVDEEPGYHKELTKNYATDEHGNFILDDDGQKMWDGTYTLSLDVTGKKIAKDAMNAGKADVILILDMSSSMVDIPVHDTTRFAIEKEAVKSFGKNLLEQNDANPDSVRLTVFTFGNVADETIVDHLTDKSQFKDIIDDSLQPPNTGVGGIQAGGQGTNWEAALQKAKEIETRSDAEKYVIFVSDGVPTFRKTRGNLEGWNGANFEDRQRSNPSKTGYYDQLGLDVYGFGTDKPPKGDFYLDSDAGRQWLNYAALLCYENAKDEARDIVDSGKKFYGISVFETINVGADDEHEGTDCMEGLVSYAYGDSGEYPKDRYKEAQSSNDMEVAFQSLFQTVSKSVDFRNVKISDPLTIAAKTTASITGKPVDFKYYKVKNGVPEVWEDAPAAEYTGSGTAGQVDWNLGETFPLENDVTYRVAFTVWPNQDAYDAVLELNGANGNAAEIAKILKKEKYKNIAPLITRDPDSDVFKIYSNGDATLKYTKYVSVDGGDPVPGDEVTQHYPRPNMETVTHTMKVAKVWNDSLEKNRAGSITFHIFQDGEVYKTVTLTEANQVGEDRWEVEFPVSPGLKASNIDQSEKLNDGHAYTVTEEGVSYHYEFAPETVTPMFYDGVLTYDGDSNGDNSLTGINHMRGYVDLNKQVFQSDGVTDITDSTADSFLFTVNLSDTRGDTLKPVKYEDYPATGTTADKDKVTKDSVVVDGKAYPVWYAIFEGEDRTKLSEEQVEYGIIEDGETISITPKQTFQLFNLPSWVQYTFTENVPGGYQVMEPAGGSSTGTPTYNAGTQVLFKNKKVDKQSISFSKVWLKETANLTEVIPRSDFDSWDSASQIQVELKRSVNGSVDNSFRYTYKIGSGNGPFYPEGVTDASLKEVLKLSKSEENHVATFSTGMTLEPMNAEKQAYTYFVVETSATGGAAYNTYYGTISENGVTRKSQAAQAYDGEVIMNQKSPGYELPSTGGPGTRHLTLLGALVLAGAGAALVTWRRKTS